MFASCENGGERHAECVYRQTRQINVNVVTDIDEKFYNYDAIFSFLKGKIPGLKFRKVDYKSNEGKKLIKELKISTLPCFIFDASVDKQKFFGENEDAFKKQGNKYILKADFSGVFLFLNREKIPGKVDVFLNLFSDSAKPVIDSINELRLNRDVKLRFIMREKEGNFVALDGLAEVEEALRIVAIEKLYPGKLWDYLVKRFSNIRSTWWQKYTEAAGIDSEKVKLFATSEKAKELLSENIKLANELRVGRGPVILIDNIKIFAVQKGSKGYDLLKGIFKE